MPDSPGEARYRDGGYLRANPDWHVADSTWKAGLVLEMIREQSVRCASVCEVGCGAGEVLRTLHEHFGGQCVGYEISPDAYRLAIARAGPGLEFRLGDAAADDSHYDLMLLLDVVEHVPDSVAFLTSLRHKADAAIMHIPLELSVQSILRPGRLERSRRTLGHVHFYNAELARATVREAGYELRATRYTCSGVDRPPQSILARAARAPRRLMRLSEPLAARTLGGFGLLLLVSADRC